MVGVPGLMGRFGFDDDFDRDECEARIVALETQLDPRAPAGALAETFPRGSVAATSTLVLASGTLRLHAIPLTSGQTITNIVFVSGVTGAANCTHCWFSLYSPSRVLLGVTNDDTATTPWTGNTVKSMALTTPYNVTTSGLYYIGIVMVGTVFPQLKTLVEATTGTMNGITPILVGNTSNTGLTSPATAPNPATAPVASNSLAYGYVT